MSMLSIVFHIQKFDIVCICKLSLKKEVLCSKVGLFKLFATIV